MKWNLLKKKKFPANKSPGPDGFTGEVHQTHKKCTAIPFKLLQKIEEQGTFPESFCEATITLPPKPTKDYKKEYYKPIYLNIWAPLITQLVKNPPAMQEIPVDFWVGKIHWRRDRLPIPVFLGFPGGSTGEESACNAGDLGSIPGLEDPSEQGMATHSSILAWRIPWTEKPGGL